MNVNEKSAKLRAGLVGACLLGGAVASPAAFAQDAAQPAQPPAGEKKPADEAKKPAEDAKKKSATEDAVSTVPAWESYGAGYGEVTMEETFFRLSRDFVTNSDEGLHRLGSVPVWPRGDLKIGGFRVMPYLREGAKWDSNYYRQPDTGEGAGVEGRKTEWTHQNEAGLLADTALMGGRLGISTYIDSIWDVHYGHDAPPDTWDFEGQIGATYFWPTGVWASVGYRYSRQHDVAEYEPIAEDFGRSIHGAFFTVGFDRDIFFGSRLRFEFGVRTREEAATENEFEDIDRNETIVYGKASYPFLGRDTTRIFAIASETFHQRHSESINDGNVFAFNVGIEGSIPLREGEYRGLRGQLSMGFQRGIYDNDTYDDGSQTFIQDDDDRNTNVQIMAALQYIMSSKTTMDLRYNHETEFSTHGNYQLVDRIEFGVSHAFNRQLSGQLDLYYEHSDPSGENPHEPLNGIDLSESAPNVNREGAGIGFRYAINDWMDVDMSMSVENRNDVPENSFKNYQGLLGFTFYLNALTSRMRAPVDD